MDITTVIVNYQTPDLLKAAVQSFKTFYADAEVLIIDNGSKDQNESKDAINDLRQQFQNIQAVFLKENIFHGPAMDIAMRSYISSDYVFFLDSDTKCKKEGFLEEMVSLFNSEQVYGVGEIIKANKRGYKSENGYKVLLTPYMLLDVKKYLTLRPFIHHGQPTINNFINASELGYELRNFKISEYIDHLWRGTASRYGYGLGWKGKVDFILNKLGF